MTTPAIKTRIQPRRLRHSRVAAASLACMLAFAPSLSAQAASVIWVGGSGNWANGPSWIGAGGGAPGSYDSVYIDNGNLLNSAVTLTSSYGAGRLYIDAGDSLSVSNGGMLSLYDGVLSNNGSLLIAAANSGASNLYLGAHTTLSGSGTTVLASDPSGYRGTIYGQGTLTIASGHTLRGAGNLGVYYSGLGVLNKGTVIAEGGTLNITSSTTASFDNSAGLVQVADTATLYVSGAFSGGTVQSLGSGSKLGGATFYGVALQGPFEVASSLSLNNASINGSLRVGTGSLQTSGTITSSGTLTVAASALGNASLYTNDNTILAGSGTTVLASDPSGYRGTVYGQGSLTIASGHTLRGAGDLGVYYSGLGVLNKGTVIAEGGTLNITSGTTASFDNSAGLVQVADAATLYVSGAFSGGTVQSLGSGSKLGGSTFYGVALQGPFEVAGSLSLSNASIDGSLRVRTGSIQTSGTITNTGTLTVGATPTGGAVLYTNGDTTLTGSGTTVLAADASGYRGTVNGQGGLTIASGHTLRGAGDLGTYYNNLGVINQGSVIAEGGTLNLNAGTSSALAFDNTAGLVQVASTGTLNQASGSFLGGTIQSLGSGAKLGGGTFYGVALQGPFEAAGYLSLNNVSIDGSLRVGAGTLQTRGTITNAGTLTLAGTSSGTAYLSTTNATTLTGSGSTVLSSDPSGYRAVVSGNGTLTIASGHTLRGAGDLGVYYNNLGVINQGTVIAESGSLNLYAGASSALVFDNTAGLVQVANAATLNMVSGTFSGGTIQGLGQSTLAGGTFKDVTLIGSLRVANATLSGTINNQGTLTLAANNQGPSSLALASATTLVGKGSTVLSSDTSGYRAQISGSGALTIAGDHTLRGAGDLGVYYNNLGVINQGTVIAEGGTLNLYAGTSSALAFDNTAGLVQVGNAATLYMASGTFTGGTIQGLGQSTLAGGTFKDVTLTGHLRLANTTVSDTINNTGTLTLAASNQSYNTLALAAATTIAGSGSTVLASDPSGYRAVISGSGALTIASGHTLRGTGDLGYYYSSLGVINQGTVIAEGGTLNIYSGATAFDNTAGVLAAMSDSTLSFIGALDLADTSLLRISVTGSTNDAHVGQLLLGSDAAFDGQVLLDLSGYSGAQVGDSFTFASYTGSYTGAFDAVTAAGYTFSTSYANHQVTATITSISAVPEPGSWAMLLAGLLAVGSVARRRSKAR